MNEAGRLCVRAEFSRLQGSPDDLQLLASGGWSRGSWEALD